MSKNLLLVRIFTFCTLLSLSGCGKSSNFGLNNSFFSGLKFWNNDDKSSDSGHKSHNKSKKQLKNDKTSIFKNIDSLKSMSISEIESKFGEPSFVIYNSDVGDDKTSYYFMSWYYVSYEMIEDNISHNHTINSNQSLIVRFDSTLNVVGAQLLYQR
jgi:outer membrane protein assembly factor BamE (lipoprotein component of BamABCDE complex)